MAIFTPLLVISSHDPEIRKGASSLGAKGGSLHYAMSLRTKYTTFLSLSMTFYLIFARPPIFSQGTPLFSGTPTTGQRLRLTRFWLLIFCSAKTQAERVSHVYVPSTAKTPVFPAPYPCVLTTNVSSTASVSRPTHPRTYSTHASGARS